jgi:hypothetical protein
MGRPVSDWAAGSPNHCRGGRSPLFKLLWLGAVRLTEGSYFGMILLLWITHVAVYLLLGCLLARFDLPAAAIAFALLTFGLSWTRLAMRWNAQLAIVFFLPPSSRPAPTEHFDPSSLAAGRARELVRLYGLH